MSEDTNSEWQKAYESFDGSMKDCLGKNCSTPCCNLKTTPTWGKGDKQYSTSLDVEEYQLQISNFGHFPPEVQTELVDVGIDRVMQMRYLVRGCLADDGTCRLRDRKPLHCRIFPLSLSEFVPLRTSSCPQSMIIASSPDVKEGILGIRKALGYRDNEEWSLTLNRMLQGSVGK